ATNIGCAGDLVTVDLGTSSGALRVEIAPASERSFHRAGPLGLSPVGEFADWDAEPAGLRAAFDAVTSCATADPGLASSLHLPAVDASRSARDAPVRDRSVPSLPVRLSNPWRWLLAIGAAAFACGASLRKRARFGPAVATAGAVLVAAALCASFRLVTVPVAFLHQNGQGPLWVEQTTTDGLWPYGNGYREIFALVAGIVPGAPERGVFALSA